MPSTFNTDYADCALPELMEIHGEPATFTPQGGSPVALSVMLVGALNDKSDREMEHFAHWPTRVITVGRNPLDDIGGIAAPAPGGLFVLEDGTSWVVEDFSDVSDRKASLVCALQGSDRFLKQTLTYWAPGTPSGAGSGMSYGGATSILGQWRQSSRKFMTNEGEEAVSQAVIFLASDVALGGYLYNGASVASDPKTIGAFEILRFDKIPKVSGTQFLRTAFL